MPKKHFLTRFFFSLVEIEAEVARLRKGRNESEKELQSATSRITLLEGVSALQHQLESESQLLRQRKSQMDTKIGAIKPLHKKLLQRQLDVNKLIVPELEAEINQTQGELNA